MKIVYTGKESSGKSLMLSKVASDVLYRDSKWLKQLKKIEKKRDIDYVPSTMAFNMPMSKHFIKEVENRGIKYIEWQQFHEIENLTDADIFIDELLKIFPSRGSDPLPPPQMDFLTQGAKSGIHIFATSQDFSQVHKQFRLLTNKVYIVRKLIGSKRPMKRMPPVDLIWGMCIKQSVKPESFKGDNISMQTDWMPLPFLIKEKDTKRYDTLYKVPRAQLPDYKVRQQRIYAVNDDGETIYEKFRYL